MNLALSLILTTPEPSRLAQLLTPPLCPHPHHALAVLRVQAWSPISPWGPPAEVPGIQALPLASMFFQNGTKPPSPGCDPRGHSGSSQPWAIFPFVGFEYGGR